MKKQVKKIILGLIIMAVTLAAGFGITIISFNLFESMSANQMKILFAADIIILALTATGVWYFLESKNIKAKKQNAFEERRKGRICKREKEMQGINEIINLSNFAA